MPASSLLGVLCPLGLARPNNSDDKRPKPPKRPKSVWKRSKFEGSEFMAPKLTSQYGRSIVRPEHERSSRPFAVHSADTHTTSPASFATGPEPTDQQGHSVHARRARALGTERLAATSCTVPGCKGPWQGAWLWCVRSLVLTLPWILHSDPSGKEHSSDPCQV